ncbi:MAG: hypothetical protein ACREDJ_07750, partial [Methylocella sp.]
MGLLAPERQGPELKAAQSPRCFEKLIAGKLARQAMFATRSPQWRSPDAVARSVEDEDAAALGLPVLDATCPLVSKVHSQGER